jgi:1-deoxy-D-xylulose-5-phosphate synthase
VDSILDTLDLPGDIRGLTLAQLGDVAKETRSLIIETVSRTGGHLGANLGVVELTAAMLKVFDVSQDKMTWDVSHQCYAYKILTDRRQRFGSLRQPGGISGFLRRDESPYDAYGAGHAGTALSAALGMAVARDRRGGSEHVIAVIGDASASCGSSFEALNNVAGTTPRLIVILNDNEMSISANVGSLSRYLGGLLSAPRYNRWKKSIENVAVRRLRLGWMRRAYYRMEEAIKSLFLDSMIFEEFGLRYIGPIDGHNLAALVDALTIARDSEKPIVLHVATTKGYGYPFAEEDPEKWHGTCAFEIETGLQNSAPPRVTYSQVFGRTVERLAAQDSRIVAITAGMCAGTGLQGFKAKFPGRFFDVGIAEEHAGLFAAGLAAAGALPFYAVYSTFSQRLVDCMIHDICLQNLPVVLCLDRAGIVGDDGPTHHGVFDIALLRCVPGLVFMQPRDEPELANMLYTAARLHRPVVIRYPRGSGTGAALPQEYSELQVGAAEVVRPGRAAQIWALGDMVPAAEKAALLLQKEGVDAGVVNARFIRPLDTSLLRAQAQEAAVFATMENGVLAGGFGSSVAEDLAAQRYAGRVLRFGWPDSFVPQGAPGLLMAQFGLTAEAVADAIRRELGANRI